MFSNRLLIRFLLIILVSIAISCTGKTSNKETVPGSPEESSVSSQAESASPGTESNSHEATSGAGTGASITDPAKELALQRAALDGDAATVTKLVEAGIPVDAQDQEKRTALMYASFNGHKEIVEYLIESGAEVGLRDAEGRTALLYASTGPFPETVRLLLENNADPNIKEATESFTPIMHAAAEGQLEVVKILLEYGADPNYKDVDGETAYMFAVANGHTAVAEFLK